MNSVNHFLELIAKEVKLVLGQLSSDRMNLDDQLKVANASSYYNQVSDTVRAVVCTWALHALKIPGYIVVTHVLNYS